MASEYAFRAGEYAELSIRSNAVISGRYFVRVRYKTGKIDTLSQTFTTVATWTNETFPSAQAFTDDGVVLNATVRSDTSAVKGTAYGGLYITPSPSSGMNIGNLAQGYLHDLHNLNLGDSEQIDWPETVAFMNVTLDQANVAGGAVVVEIVPGAGNAFQVLEARATNSGTNTVFMGLFTAALGTRITDFVQVGSGAGTNGAMPQFPALHATSTTIAGSGGYPVSVYGTQALNIRQTGAGAQGDNFDVLVLIRVRGALPTVTFANSTNPGDVTVVAGALSFAFIS